MTTIPTITIVTGSPQYSYISYDDAQDYFANRLNSNIWDGATEVNRKKALVTATKRIDLIRFKGFVCAEDQPLQFPRYILPNYLSKHTYTDKINLVNINGQNVIYVDITDAVKEATCEEAISLLEFGNSAHLKNQALGITSMNFGGGSSSYAPTGNELISVRALQLLDKYMQKVGKVV
jgi:hypothetical protein